jgi:hypothetical protein
MAAFGRSLCLFLTLWMAGSRPATVIPPRLPDSSLRSKSAFLLIQQDARRLREKGDFRAAEAVYQQGYREARGSGDRLFAIKCLISAGGCQLLTFQYRTSLATFLQARQSAVVIEDHADLGAIAVNLSSLYMQMWDLPAAMRAAEEGLRQDVLSKMHSPEASYFKPKLLIQLGRIHTLLADRPASAFFSEGIEAARAKQRGARSAGLGSSGRGASGQSPPVPSRNSVLGGFPFTAILPAPRTGFLLWAFGRTGVSAE